MNFKSPTLFITALFIFGSICLSSDTKRLSEAERLKLAIEIATQKPNRGIMIEQAEGYYTASFTLRGESITPIGSIVDAIQPTIIQSVDGLMKTCDRPNNYPEPRVLNYQEVKEPKENKEEKSLKEQNKEKLKALQVTIDKIEKTYGKGAIMKMGDTPIEEIEVISTGSVGLDAALGVGGFPKGRVIEIYGPESSGKTTLAIHAIAEAQKSGGIAAFIDAEHAFDRSYAQKLGVDTENLLISQPDNGEQALEITENLIRSGAIDIIVIDSVAALTPKSEIEGEMGDSKMGLQARLMSQALRKLTGTINKTNCCCIFINQLREKIGVMFGNPETTTGGNALKFYASVRLDIRRTGQLKDGDSVFGNRVKVKVIKNKVAPPFRIAEFDILYGEGISKIGEIIDIGVDLNIIKKSGSWFSYGDTKLGQGRDSVKQILADNPELSDEIETKVREELSKAALA